MEVELQAISELHFASHNLVEEIINGETVVFFVDHVESRDEVGAAVSLNDSVKLGLDMTTAEHFQSTDDEFHAEKRESDLDLLETFLEDGEFLHRRQRVAIVIKDAAKDMTVFNDSDHLVDKVASHSVEDTLKQGLVVIQLECQRKLGLEAFPDFVVCRTASGGLQRHLILQVLVKLFGVFPILSQGVHLNKSRGSARLYFSRNVKCVFLLGVEDAVSSGEAYEEVEISAGCKMGVVDCRFGEHLEHIV